MCRRNTGAKLKSSVGFGGLFVPPLDLFSLKGGDFDSDPRGGQEAQKLAHQESGDGSMLNGQVSICMVGRNRLFRMALKLLLGKVPSFNVIYEADEADKVSPLTHGQDNEKSVADLILFDMSEDSNELIEGLYHLHQRLPETPIVVMNDNITVKALQLCLDGGASGYLTRDISFDALQHSLQLIALGEKVFPTHLADLLVNNSASWSLPKADPAGKTEAGLSGRECQILRCLVGGESNKEIANRLNITESTVKVHMKSLLRKIQAGNRTQAAIWALTSGLVEPPADSLEYS